MTRQTQGAKKMETAKKRINDLVDNAKAFSRALMDAGCTPESLGITSQADYERVRSGILSAALDRVSELTKDYGQYIDAHTVVVEVAQAYKK
jgi:hypothetical protein